MNLIELHKKLIGAARTQRPNEHVPYAFEKRIMARLSQPVADVWLAWSRGLWRAAAPCLAITMLLGVWSYLTPVQNNQAKSGSSLSQDFENTMFAAVDQDNNSTSW